MNPRFNYQNNFNGQRHFNPRHSQNYPRYYHHVQGPGAPTMDGFHYGHNGPFPQFHMNQSYPLNPQMHFQPNRFPQNPTQNFNHRPPSFGRHLRNQEENLAVNGSQSTAGRSKKRFSKQRNVSDNREPRSNNDQELGSHNQHQNDQVTARTSNMRGKNKPPIRFSHQIDQNTDAPATVDNDGSNASCSNEKILQSQNKSSGRSASSSHQRGVKKSSQNLKQNGRRNPPAEKEETISKEKEIKEKGDQASVLLEQLNRGTYECMVCCDYVRPTHAIWNCLTCHHVFHMHCIKKWARSEAAKTDSGWRCPGCQSVNKKVPQAYYCFCGKTRDPALIRGETAHSCGNVCGRNRPSTMNCKHPCTDLCHPGPCAKCPAMVTNKCRCGALSLQVRCNRQTALLCEKSCNRLRNCRLHRCQATCCGGDCKPCELVVKQQCFCGSESREVVCGSEEHMSSHDKGNDKTGYYTCGKVCGKYFECLEHTCTRVCHKGPCGTCTLAPSMVKTCPCTQTPISQIKVDGKSVVRRKCTDPIPLCDKICKKPLECGGDDIHLCELPCHHGACLPCLDGFTSVTCRCGKTTKDMPCGEFAEMTEEFKCDKRCNRKRNCGRHKCGKTCCIDKEHVCTQVCGRKLTCGLHRCEEPCHRGKCHTCYNVSFDELSCHCGEEIIYPPIQCGTAPPQCGRICSRMHDCSHPVRHTCHTEESCPPCIELVKKLCNCGRLMRGNILCHVVNVSCGNQCVKFLPCGHQCPKQCHRGACLEEDEKCEQPCSEIRKECVHPCAVACHHGRPCPDDSPCSAMVTCRCACGRREQQVNCSQAIKMRKKLAERQLNAVATSDHTTNMSDIIKIGQERHTLRCNEECHVAERNRKMAEALNISISTAEEADPCDIFSDFLLQTAKKDPKFVAEIENELRSLVESVRWFEHKTKSHSFRNMKRDKRQVVHELAQAFRCTSLSYDVEPRRYVCVTAHKHKSVEPMRSLSEVANNPRAYKQHANGSVSTYSGGSVVGSMKLVQYTSSQHSPVKSSSHTSRDPPPTCAAPMKRVPAASGSGGHQSTLSVSQRSSWTAEPSASSSTAKPPPIDYFDMSD